MTDLIAKSRITLVVAAFSVLFAHSVFGQSSSLTLSSGTAASDGTVALNLNLTSTAGTEPAAVQWKFTFAAADIVSISATTGGAATAAGKALDCVSATGSYVCVASGTNANAIGNGTLAVVNVKISAGVATTSIGLTNGLASSAAGSSMTVSQTGGTITGYVPTPVPTVSALSCNPTTLFSGGTSTCTVTLSGAAASGGTSVSLSDNSPVLTVPGSVTVSSGNTSATFSATAGTVASNQTAVITASANGGSKTASLSLAPPPSGSYSIWSSSTAPANIADADTQTVELGLKFRSSVNGYVTGVRFYKGSQNTGTHVGHLWSSTGTLLATATFSGESASGWQQASFPSPVAINASTTYVISYVAPAGHYSGDNGYFTSSSVTNGPLTALRDGDDGGNGLYRYGQSVFPNSTWQSSNYWVDVVFQASTPAPTVTVSSLSCTPATLASGATSTCTVTLSGAAPTGGASVTLSDNSSLLTVPASVTVASSATTATFTATAGTVTANATAVVTATLNGGSKTASLSLTAAAVTVSSLACTPTTLTSGGASTCTVTLSGAAPTGGASVALSDNSSLLTVPASVTVASSATTATFTATAGTVTANSTAVVTATLNGGSKTASLSLTAAAVTVSSLACTPTTLTSGGASTCTVTLSGAAPTGGASVTLSDNSSLLTVPASVAVASSATTATFTATAGTVTANSTAVVTATLNGGSKTASLSLTAAAVTVSSLACTPTTLASGAKSTCTVTLSGAAPTGGASVTLSDNSSLLTVPASVTVASSATTATFTATAGTVTANATAVVTAALNGGSKTASLSLTAPSTSYSVWSSSTTPANLTDPDKLPVELGLKFRSSVAGQVTGVRFYKGSQNTGTHIGHLWSNTGTLLATVTFTGETASGWQQATFSTPVSISANTTYIVSYLAPVGRYSGDNGYFSSASVTNGPLTALRDGTDGGNGVYRYGSSVFPNSTWKSSNYWVDVVFQPASSLSATETAKTTSVEKSSLASGHSSSLTCSPRVVRPGDSFSCELQLGNASGPVNISVDGSDKVILPSTVTGRLGQSRISFRGSVDERATPQSITVLASLNGQGVEDNITVLPASAPVIVVPPDQLIRSGDTVAFKVAVNSSAPAGISALALPKGASFDVSSGQFQWTPGPDQLGEYGLKFKAIAAGSSSTTTVHVVVDDGQAVVGNSQDLVCAPGSIATLTGKWLGPDQPIADLTGGSLELGGTTVRVNGSLVPVLTAGQRRVSFLCPESQPGDTLEIALQTPASSAAVVTTTMRALNPALSAIEESTQGAIFSSGTDKLAVVQNATLAGQPAQPGDVVTLHATGLRDGTPVSVKIGDVTVSTVSVSRVADQAGVWAIQVTVPSAPQFGSSVPVRIEVNSADGRQLHSNTVTMAIEPSLP